MRGSGAAGVGAPQGSGASSLGGWGVLCSGPGAGCAVEGPAGAAAWSSWGAGGSSFRKRVPWGWRVCDAGAGRGVTGSCPGPRAPPGTPIVQRGPGPLGAVCHTRARASPEEEGSARGRGGGGGLRGRRGQTRAGGGQSRPQVQHDPKPPPALNEEGRFGRVRGQRWLENELRSPWPWGFRGGAPFSPGRQ